MARRRGATRLPRVWILIDTQTPRRPDAPSIVSDARTPPLSSRQDLDDEYLVIWDGFDEGVPWRCRPGLMCSPLAPPEAPPDASNAPACLCIRLWPLPRLHPMHATHLPAYAHAAPALAQVYEPRKAA